MKISTFTSLLLIAALLSGCNARTYDFRKDYDTVYDLGFVKELKGNNLFVQLVNHQEIIDNYRGRGKEKSATNWEKDDAKYNAVIMQTFRESWNFCDVFFYDQELYFNTDEFIVTDINGKKHKVELEREQIFLGKFLEFCTTNSLQGVNPNGSRYNNGGQTHLMLEKWPEDGSRGKKTLKLESAGCLTKSSVKLLVKQMQKKLDRTYQGKAN